MSVTSSPVERRRLRGGVWGPVLVTAVVLLAVTLPLGRYVWPHWDRSYGRELRFDRETLNINGGAIALGHPIGCSGARIVVTLLHEMARRGSRLGLATLCVSGGLGGALIVERGGA